MNVDEMMLEQLRVAIAERAGYKWKVLPGSPILMPPSHPGLEYWKDAGPPVKLNRRHFALCPDWPADPAAADALLDDLDKRGANYELASLSGEGFQLAIITDAPMDEIWSFSAHGKTRQEAICRAWLKATVAE